MTCVHGYGARLDFGMAGVLLMGRGRVTLLLAVMAVSLAGASVAYAKSDLPDVDIRSWRRFTTRPGGSGCTRKYFAPPGDRSSPWA